MWGELSTSHELGGPYRASKAPSHAVESNRAQLDLLTQIEIEGDRSPGSPAYLGDVAVSVAVGFTEKAVGPGLEPSLLVDVIDADFNRVFTGPPASSRASQRITIDPDLEIHVKLSGSASVHSLDHSRRPAVRAGCPGPGKFFFIDSYPRFTGDVALLKFFPLPTEKIGVRFDREEDQGEDRRGQKHEKCPERIALEVAPVSIEDLVPKPLLRSEPDGFEKIGLFPGAVLRTMGCHHDL